MSLLNNNSILSAQPDSDIQLWKHQLAMLNKCKEIEKTHKYGIMNDSAGSGKTYVVLALLLDSIIENPKQTNIIVVPHNIYKQWTTAINLFFKKHPIKFNSFIEYADVIDLYHSNTKLTNSQIILTTSIYYTQILSSMCDLKHKVYRIFFDEIDYIDNLINATTQKIKMNAKYKMSNNGNIVSESDLDISKIKWYISASYKTHTNSDNMCRCEKEFIDESIVLETPKKISYLCNDSYIGILNTVLNRTKINKINAMDFNFDFKNISKTPTNDKELLMYLVEDMILDLDKSKVASYDISNKLFIEYDNIKSKNNIIDSEIYPFLENKLSKLLETIEYNEKNNIPEDNNIKNEFNYINSIIMLNAQKADFEKNIKNIQTKLDNINNRLKESNLCLVCMSDFDTINYKVITKCCQNTFCNGCVQSIIKTGNTFSVNDCKACVEPSDTKDNVVVLGKSITCPMCRASVCLKHDIVVINNIKEDTTIKANVDIIDEKPFIDTNNPISNKICNLNKDYMNLTKFEVLKTKLKIIFDTNKSKVIIFADYDYIFNEIKNFLNESRIKFTALDGGNIEDLNRAYTNYKEKDYNVLLSNSNIYGCGMNLENTTDIILLHKIGSKNKYKQVIGRAQRPGRNTILNIYELVNENELIDDEEDIQESVNSIIDNNEDDSSIDLNNIQDTDVSMNGNNSNVDLSNFSYLNNNNFTILAQPDSFIELNRNKNKSCIIS